MVDTGPSAPRWALFAPAAAPPILTFNEPSMDLHILSRTDSHNSSSDLQLMQPRQPISAGEACSPEGQWNCMTTAWQRCASGSWSAVVACSTGTVCQPVGLTDYITIEHTSGFDNGEPHGEDGGHASDRGDMDDGGRSGRSSDGVRDSPGLVLLLGAFVVGVSWGFLV